MAFVQTLKSVGLILLIRQLRKGKQASLEPLKANAFHILGRAHPKAVPGKANAEFCLIVIISLLQNRNSLKDDSLLKQPRNWIWGFGVGVDLCLRVQQSLRNLQSIVCRQS